ncbi:MAG: hypothetical protein AAGI52_07335 [Bacteroidota bacterium]
MRHRLLLVALAVSLVGGARAQTGDLPLGLGIAQPVALSAETPLYFYASADAKTPLDSLTVSEGPHHVEIASAPPWLDPQIAMLDGETVTLRVIGKTRHAVEVIVHDREVRWPPRTMWLRREAVTVIPWADYWLDIHSIETPETSPIHAAPGREAVGVTESGRPLHVLETRHAWARVAYADATEAEAGPLGWIRWHDGTRLLVRYNVRS